MGGALVRGWLAAIRRGGGLTLTVVEPNFDPGLERELAATRARGSAFEEDETVDGVACFAAPLALLGEPLAAISVSVPVHRFPEARRTALTLAVQQIAQPAALTSA
jgi:DNA-binding IclR family transcriptional regulator